MNLDEMIFATDTDNLNPHLKVPMRRGDGFRILADHASSVNNPHIVETGCLRETNDWAGAGCSTLILALLAHAHGGSFVTIDNNAQRMEVAKDALRAHDLMAASHLVGDSARMLAQWFTGIDILYLDSQDTTEPGYAEHCLREVEAALPHMSGTALIAIDDSPHVDSQVIGKGALAVPHLIGLGWELIHDGYQAILSNETK